MRFNFLPIDAVTFGEGSAEELANDCERLGLSRLMLIASKSLCRQLDVEATFQKSTGGRIAAVYTGGRPHVPHASVIEAAEAARAAGVDGLLSVGGGSVIDLSKGVALCLAENLRSPEQVLDWRVVFEYPDRVEIPASSKTFLPHISVSTTLSAGEFTNIIGITDEARMTKDLYIPSGTVVPRLSVLDPAMATYTPRDLWGSTGMRAVDHAVEAICSTTAQPVTDALCADALARLTRYLPVSVKDANDLQAANECQVAAWESIMGLTNVNLGLSHGIGHQLGARCGVPHGVTSCVMLPSVLEFNLDHTAEAQARIRSIFAAGMGVPDRGEGAGPIVRDFIASLGLPTSLREVGVEPSQFPLLAEDAMADLIVASNPRPVGGTADVIAILEAAY